MRKRLLVSLICLSTLAFSSCGRTHVNVTILECFHCSFENKTSAKVGEDFVIQAYVDDNYVLYDENIEVTAGGTQLVIPCFTYSEETKKITIYKQYVSFGDITIKATACVPEPEHILNFTSNNL